MVMLFWVTGQLREFYDLLAFKLFWFLFARLSLCPITSSWGRNTAESKKRKSSNCFVFCFPPQSSQTGFWQTLIREALLSPTSNFVEVYLLCTFQPEVRGHGFIRSAVTTSAPWELILALDHFSSWQLESTLLTQRSIFGLISARRFWSFSIVSIRFLRLVISHSEVTPGSAAHLTIMRVIRSHESRYEWALKCLERDVRAAA